MRSQNVDKDDKQARSTFEREVLDCLSRLETKIDRSFPRREDNPTKLLGDILEWDFHRGPWQDSMDEE